MHQCDHTKKDCFMCPLCGADLDLAQEEIHLRDDMFKIFHEGFEEIKDRSDFNEKFKDFNFDRKTFDYWLSRNSAVFLFKILGMFAGDDKSQNKAVMSKEGNKNLEERVTKLERSLGKLRNL